MEEDSERATDESQKSLVMEDSVQSNTAKRNYRFTTKKNIVFYIHQFLTQGYEGMYLKEMNNE